MGDYQLYLNLNLNHHLILILIYPLQSHIHLFYMKSLNLLLNIMGSKRYFDQHIHILLFPEQFHIHYH